VIPRRADLFLSILEAVVMEALGEDGFARLVAAFYRRVREDDLIGPMYPPEDWEGAERRLADFLIFRFGGSERYLQERGHPRLRMRHVPFSIGEAERDRWLKLMGAAMDEMGLSGEARVNLEAFFDQVADFMRNREG
jgi:hemoglobin